LTDREIEELFRSFVGSGREVNLTYTAPNVVGGGHCLELEIENPAVLASVIAWTLGAVDWEVFDKRTVTIDAVLIGHAEPRDVTELKAAVLEVFRQIDEYEANTQAQHGLGSCMQHGGELGGRIHGGKQD
jgi:hypothetical protein